MEHMQKFLVLVLIVVAIWLGYRLVAGTNENIVNYPPRGTNVVAFGDSLVEGVGATPGGDWPRVVSEKLEVPVVNMGKRGDTTKAGLQRVNSALSALSKKPDVVIILLGGNDALQGIPIEETEKNLREIVARFQETGAVTIIAGVRGGLASDPYSSMYWRLAQDTGSLLVTDVLRGLFGNRKYMADAIHPNDAGYEVIASRIALPLKNALRDVQVNKQGTTEQ